MKPVHRLGDLRACGASTIPAGNAIDRRVLINGRVVSLMGDVNTDGGGALTATAIKVFVNGRNVVLLGDPAAADSLCPSVGGAHCAPAAAQGSPNVFIGT
jgi:uncharacterized Zn-binding protein involved in type VI secretion